MLLRVLVRMEACFVVGRVSRSWRIDIVWIVVEFTGRLFCIIKIIERGIEVFIFKVLFF